jgi:seryl-tRNA synthetase
MIDLRDAREHPDEWRRRLARKGGLDEFDRLLDVDARWRELTPRVDELRRSQKLKGKPTPEQLEELVRVKEELARVEAEYAQLVRLRDELLRAVPNPPHDSAPDGDTEEDAEEVRRVGEPRVIEGAKDHLELGGFDLERGARLSGSRFGYIVGGAALVELALYRYALDKLVAAGFTPMLPPVLVRYEAMYGTGFFPTEESNIYAVPSDELYLTGTSEVGLAGYHIDEILDAGALPLRYTAFSTCFRREAGAAGRDTRGMFRVHQFNKVEMFAFTRPEDSWDEHERLLAIEEELAQGLGVPYRVVNVAAGDLGASAAKKYDVEGWFPGQQRYREITSCSNTTDYQARRLGIRYRNGKGTHALHTLNGTAVTGRWTICVLENFQQPDGTVAVPETLQRFGVPAVIQPGVS